MNYFFECNKCSATIAATKEDPWPVKVVVGNRPTERLFICKGCENPEDPFKMLKEFSKNEK